MKIFLILTFIFGAMISLVYSNPSLKESIKVEIKEIPPEYKVVKIFDYDGCTGYSFRIKDSSFEHYFVKCGNEVTASTKKICGKSSCLLDIKTEPK